MPTDGGGAFRVRSGRQKVSNASAENLAFTGRLKYTGVPGLVQLLKDKSQAPKVFMGAMSAYCLTYSEYSFNHAMSLL